MNKMHCVKMMDIYHKKINSFMKNKKLKEFKSLKSNTVLIHELQNDIERITKFQDILKDILHQNENKRNIRKSLRLP